MKSRSKGFTFIEVIISLALVGVISGLSISMLLQGTDIFMKAKEETQLLNESRTSIWRIARELHNLSSNHLLALSNDNRLYIKDAKSNQIDFSIVNNNVLNVNRAGATNPLSGSLDQAHTNQFQFISSQNSIIASSQNLTDANASLVNLLKIKFRFKKDNQVLDLRTHVYPYNFKFGKKMSYHD
jgi:prepilin-type N-terminal cleavage/methylation domain-containing protein|tara:strand:- start:853 stop:1404 length:552 start_codon:yes stop_codon:yes gene_type:complete